jgi:hypothetical protein
LWPRLGKPDLPNQTPNIYSLKHWAEQTQTHGQAFWRELRLLSLGCTIDSMIKGLTQ